MKKVGWSLLDKAVLGLPCSREKPVTFDYCGNSVANCQVVRYSPTMPSHSGLGWRRLMAGFIQSWSVVRLVGQKEKEM